MFDVFYELHIIPSRRIGGFVPNVEVPIGFLLASTISTIMLFSVVEYGAIEEQQYIPLSHNSLSESTFFSWHYEQNQQEVCIFLHLEK